MPANLAQGYLFWIGNIYSISFFSSKKVAYFEGMPKRMLPEKTKSKEKNNFFEDVYEVVRLVPKGRVTSYGAIANYLGTKMSARMVGWAMNACHGLGIAAHRVVNAKGLLTGRHHFVPPSSMQKSLEKEGVKVKDHQVQDFDKKFWDPRRELL
jgi:methylated-DNA-protein-cysteine methyltransferase-like protein